MFKKMFYGADAERMQIQSTNQKSVLELVYIQSERDRLPSISLSVAVSDSGFCGENLEVWFEVDEVSKFIADVQRLDQEQKGSAVLTSMSPDECALTIRSMDRSGHLILEYLLSSQVYLEHSSQKRHVSGGFDLDSADLASIYKFFSTIADV